MANSTHPGDYVSEQNGWHWMSLWISRSAFLRPKALSLPPLPACMYSVGLCVYLYPCIYPCSHVCLACAGCLPVSTCQAVCVMPSTQWIMSPLPMALQILFNFPASHSLLLSWHWNLDQFIWLTPTCCDIWVPSWFCPMTPYTTIYFLTSKTLIEGPFFI